MVRPYLFNGIAKYYATRDGSILMVVALLGASDVLV